MDRSLGAALYVNCLRAAPGRKHAKPRVLQNLANGFQNGRIVLHDKDCFECLVRAESSVSPSAGKSRILRLRGRGPAGLEAGLLGGYEF